MLRNILLLMGILLIYFLAGCSTQKNFAAEVLSIEASTIRLDASDLASKPSGGRDIGYFIIIQIDNETAIKRSNGQIATLNDIEEGNTVSVTFRSPIVVKDFIGKPTGTHAKEIVIE